jgi:tyrosine-protein phosphatase SIW14
MSRSLTYLFGCLIVVVLVGGPWAYWSHRAKEQRNFRTVRDGVLYRSGQMTLDGLKRAVHDHGIRTVVSLRDSEDAGQAPPDAEEEAYCLAEAITYVRIPPRPWWSADGGPAPVEVGVRRFKEVMADRRNYPVLVHCFAGIHRTGAYCAIYRMEHERWDNAAALAEMKACGYSNLDREWDIRGYLTAYEPSWKKEANDAREGE